MGSDEVIAKQKKELAKQRKELLEKDDFISYLVKSNNDDKMAFQNKINEMKNEENKRASKKELNIQKIINSHIKMIQDLQEKNNMLETQKNTETEELKKSINKLMMKERYNYEKIFQYQKKFGNLENESKKKIEELNNKIKNEVDEKKKKESIEKAENERIQHLLCKELYDLKNKKLKIICKYFEENLSQTFCMREFNNLIQRKADNLIKYLFIGEQIQNSISYHLKKIMRETQNYKQILEHLNILLLGPTGAGKTSLINKVFNLNLEAEFGKPTTLEIKPYYSNEIPFLCLVDSRGIEKNPSAGVNFIYEEISNYIKKQINDNNPDKYIHCIWYCWTETRLENVEFEIFKKLSEEYTLNKLPIVIVYTKAVFPDNVKKAKKFLEKNNIKNDFVEVLAFDTEIGQGDSTNIVPAFGVDNLIELSIKRAKEAVDSSCYEALLRNLNNNMKLIFKKLVEILKDKLNQRIEDIISEMEKEINIENLETKLTEIIIELFSYFFCLSPDIKVDKQSNYKVIIRSPTGFLTYNFSDGTLNKIQNTVREFLKEFLDIYKKNLDVLVSKYKNELLKEIKTVKYNFIMNIMPKNQKLFKNESEERTEKNLIILFEAKLGNIAKKVAFKNFLRNFTAFIEKFATEFDKLYKKIIESDIFKEKGKQMIKLSFDKIEEKIKNYNEEIRKKNEIKQTKLENDEKKEKETSKSNNFSDKDYEDMLNNMKLFEEENEE